MPATLPDEMRIAVVGHVDHGKSTLVGRLLLSQASLAHERLSEIEHAAAQRHRAVDHAFLTDQLSEERDRRITLDVAHAMLRHGDTAITFVDTPGHRELATNMLSGAGVADAALLVVDATRGIEPQTHLHLAILRVLRVGHVVVAINKMDAVNHDQRRFRELAGAVTDLLVHPHTTVHGVVPVSALLDENLTRPSRTLAWYDGPPLMDVFQQLHHPSEDADGPPCLLTQGALDNNGTRLALVRVESGQCQVGNRLLAYPPSSRLPIPLTIHRMHRYDEPVDVAAAGWCVGLELLPAIDLERGTILGGEHLVLKHATSIAVHAVQLVEALPLPPQAVLLLHSVQGPRRGVVSALSTPSGPDASEQSLQIQLTQPLVICSGKVATLASHSRVVLSREGVVWGIGRIDGAVST